MEDENIENTYVKDMNVNVLVTSDTPSAVGSGKKTDYWSIAIIAVIMVAIAVYAFMTRGERL